MPRIRIAVAIVVTPRVRSTLAQGAEMDLVLPALPLSPQTEGPLDAEAACQHAQNPTVLLLQALLGQMG